MTKILILGNGYVGNILYNYLSVNHEVNKTERSNLDYHSKYVLSSFLRNTRPSVVIGAFGFTGDPNIDQAEILKEECWNLNVKIPFSVSSVCAEEKIPYIHISSGCIYSGYEKEWEEQDKPNFGIFDESSFYSKTKHAFELISESIPKTIVRIRMPFSSCKSQRNYINKILKYDTLINAINSRTCMSDLGRSILYMIDSGYAINVDENQVVHAVNDNPISTEDFIKEMSSLGIKNINWKLIPYREMKFKSPRSNCRLKTSNIVSYIFREEIIALRENLKEMIKS